MPDASVVTPRRGHTCRHEHEGERGDAAECEALHGLSLPWWSALLSRSHWHSTVADKTSPVERMGVLKL